MSFHNCFVIYFVNDLNISKYVFRSYNLFGNIYKLTLWSRYIAECMKSLSIFYSTVVCSYREKTCCFESCRITTKPKVLNKTNFLKQKLYKAHPLTALKIIQHTHSCQMYEYYGSVVCFLFILKYARIFVSISGFLDTYTHAFTITRFVRKRG